MPPDISLLTTYSPCSLTSHDQRTLKTQLPILPEHKAYLVGRDLGSHPVLRVPLSFGTEERLTLWDGCPNCSDEGRYSRSNPKQRTPAMAVLRDKEQVQERRYKVSNSISLLQYA